MSRPLVSIVLLCFNRPGMLAEALRSLAEQTYPNLEVLIVNNRSAETEAIATMVAEYPAFRLVAIPFNSGFTGGMNRGIAEATGEYIYLTEEDIALAPDCIEAFVREFEDDPTLALACPLMIDSESGRVRFAGGWFQLDGIYRQGDYGAGAAPEDCSRRRDVTYIAGNMIFARRSVYRDLGIFRDDIFIYYDDIDLCARALRGGKRIAFLPSAKAWSLDPPSDRPAPPMLEYHKIKNLYLIYLLHAQARCLPEFFIRYAVLAWLRSPLSLHGRLRLKAIGWTLLHLPRLLRERLSARGQSPEFLRLRLEEAS